MSATSQDPRPPGQELHCFIVAPIGSADSATRKRSDQVRRHIIDPALTPLGYKTISADDIDDSGLITTQVVDALLNSELIIADLTGSNPNVFYELGVRHASGKPFIQIIDANEALPFDINSQRSIFVNHHDLDSAAEAREQISRMAQKILDGGDDYRTESPVSQTIDLATLRGSKDPESMALADLSQGLAELRKEIHQLRGSPIGDSAELRAFKKNPNFVGLTTAQGIINATRKHASGVDSTQDLTDFLVEEMSRRMIAELPPNKLIEFVHKTGNLSEDDRKQLLKALNEEVNPLISARTAENS